MANVRDRIRTRLHHPSVSLPVIRRKAAAELLDIISEFAEFAVTSGRHIQWRSSYPSQTAYWMAVSRLRKAGLVARRRSDGRQPVLELTDAGTESLDDVMRPDRWWNQKWNGTWNLLSYDVPEANKRYRHTLRVFLRRLRLGLLHRSVWITWRDIRPDFHDLCEAASVRDFAMLFETRTVLGYDPDKLVRAVWPMTRVSEEHNQYLKRADLRLKRLTEKAYGARQLEKLARTELIAYRRALALDPLLPRNLWPAGYRGEDVYALHRRIVREIGRRL